MTDIRPSSLKIAIGIATTGRPDVLAEAIAFLSRQTRRADALLICPAREGDVNESRLVEYGAPVSIIRGPIGSSIQRNALIDASDADVMVFFDDDFLPADDFLAEMEAQFIADPELAVLTGNVLVDGAHGPGLTFSEGVNILAEAQAPEKPFAVYPAYGAYGCNMAVRMKLAQEYNIRFDESLPLYGWWEDIDFSRRLLPYGRVMRSYGLRGVHLGSKNGRTSGKRLGYSQVANMVHMARKGSITAGAAFRQIVRNMVANHVKAIKPEPWIDRLGRVKGNWKAMADLVSGRLDPRRILEF